MIRKGQFKDFSIYYTSPYFYKRTDSISVIISDRYLQQFKGLPTDFSLRGFESTFQFAKLLHTYPKKMMEHINDTSFHFFNEFHFRPVKEGSVLADQPDYFENKHLYILRSNNGVTYKAW